jgi:nonsense-mediated mRNA decay protein 3
MKIKITIQKEIESGSMLQNTFIIEFTEMNEQCEECCKSFTPHIWTAALQVRQKVDHKRTFLYLEQLILKNRAHDKCIKVSEKDDGIDFYFKSKSGANSMMNFILKKAPCRIKTAKKLISHDVQTNNYNYKYTISCEIAPVCRDDLVLLPPKLSTLCGGIGPLVLVHKVTQHIHIVDVMTMETHSMDSVLYYNHVFSGFMNRKQLTEFIVVDIDTPEFNPNESRMSKSERFRCVQVELRRVSDLGKNDKSYLVHSHLGEYLNYNDSVMCYDLEQANLPEDVWDEFHTMRKDAPDVVVVKKYFPRLRKKNRKRYWKLDRIPMRDEENIDLDENKSEDDGEERIISKKAKKAKHNRNKKKKKLEKEFQDDFEDFLKDLEEDPEMRGTVNMYKDKKTINELEQKLSSMTLDDKAKEIGTMRKLIKKKKSVKVKRSTDKGKELQAEKEESDLMTKKLLTAIKEDDESDFEEDFPAVQLGELMDNLKLDDKQ